MQKIIAVDVDGVLADIHTPWLARYNKDYNDDFTIQDIKSWGIEKYVKKECGKKILGYLGDPSLYEDTLPVLDSRYGVNILRNVGFRVVFVTDASFNPNLKMKWLQKWNFLTDTKDYYEAVDKSLIAADYLIDDRKENVQSAYGKGIIFSQPWNRTLRGYFRLDSWAGVVNLLERGT